MFWVLLFKFGLFQTSEWLPARVYLCPAHWSRGPGPWGHRPAHTLMLPWPCWLLSSQLRLVSTRGFSVPSAPQALAPRSLKPHPASWLLPPTFTGLFSYLLLSLGLWSLGSALLSVCVSVCLCSCHPVLGPFLLPALLGARAAVPTGWVPRGSQFHGL